MGMFFLCRRGVGGPPEEWVQVHADAGFGSRVSLSAGDWELSLWRQLGGAGPHYVRRGENFAACTGIFFFRGRRLEPALEELLEEFRGDAFPWHDCRGHYAVILFKGNRLFLASDELGGYKIYRTAEGDRFSSSFSAIHSTLQSSAPDVQGVYEYLFNGATFGEKTLLRQIKQQREGVLYKFREDGSPQVSVPPARVTASRGASIDEFAEEFAERLRSLFRLYAGARRAFHSAISGGYDSRLILALLLDAGIEPSLFVYGGNADPDVQVARQIAKGEGLELRRVDKDEVQAAPRDIGTRDIQLAWASFDSWNNEGLFDNGVDVDDRMARARQDVDILNGSGGECFRNFFYLREGRYSPEEIVWTFHSRYDPNQLTHRFVPETYVEELAEDIRLALPGHPRSKVLQRAQVEALYPLFRVRYWTGRDVGLNQRFGPLLFPFLEPSVFSGTELIPIAYKDYGRLEGKIIHRVSPRLASYRTAYGFSLDDDPPMWYRMKMAATLWRPPYLRQFSYRLQHRLGPPSLRPRWLRASLEAARLDPNLPAVSEFLKVDRVNDLDMLNRAATVELVLQGNLVSRQNSDCFRKSQDELRRIA